MTPPRALTEGFRAFFLAAPLFAVFAVGAWEWFLAEPGAGPARFAVEPYLWHAHEMIFGYAAAVIAGFFLTAAPNWTGGQAARAGFVTAATALWLAGRLGMWLSGALDPALVAVIDLAFLPVLASRVAITLAKRPKPQNIVLLGFVALLWAGNLLCWMEWTGLAEDTAWSGLRLGLCAVCAMIAVIGGRVTPAFTRNAMRREGRETGLPESKKPLEAIAIIGVVALGPLWALEAPEPILAALALAAGAAQLARVSLWRPGWALGDAIIWSLHLAMAMLGLGLLALGLGWAGAPVDETASLHLLGIGAVGGMTLAVMSRAALGHTGRELRAGPAVTAAYALLAISAFTRFLGPVAAPALSDMTNQISGLLWIGAFGLFLSAFWRVLVQPRLSS